MTRPALIVTLLALLTACTATPAPAPSPPPATPSTTESTPPAGQVYVSVGDSYATGYRPAADGAPAGSGDGFTDMVATASGLRLINVACSGATSGQLRTTAGCAPANRAANAPDPAGRTQLAAALAALREHEGEVGLVTVVIGGNDLAPCVRESATEAVACASRAVADVQANLAAILPALRDAAGDAQIVGLTYPDVFLGAWVSPAFPNGQDIARMSVPLFRDVFNATLEAEYAKIDAEFVDVTATTGAYEPLTDLTQDPRHGPIPAPVAKVCALTYFCDLTDVHPTPEGHRTIADAILTATGR